MKKKRRPTIDLRTEDVKYFNHGTNRAHVQASHILHFTLKLTDINMKLYLSIH